MTASAATATKWQDDVKSYWKDRIHREFCLYTNVGLNVRGDVIKGHDPQGIHTNPAYGYSQLCWQVSLFIGYLNTVAQNNGVPVEEVVEYACEHAMGEFSLHMDMVNLTSKKS